MLAVDVPQGRIEYSATGAGPPVVLLHGLLMDHTLWDSVMPMLPGGYRFIRPVMPLGSHRVPMPEGADLSFAGMAHLVADLLEALDLHDVTLVHIDWGGGLLLSALGLDARVSRLVIMPCEAFDNFPPGVPGGLARLASRVPGGIQLAARQVRGRWLQRLPVTFGHMTRRPVPQDLMRRWTTPVLADAGVRRDVRRFATQPVDPAALVRATEALRHFPGDALVLWSAHGKVMPADHGRRLADLIPRARYAEIADGRVLLPLDDPAAVAAALADFLEESDSRRPTEPHRAGSADSPATSRTPGPRP